jgi:orotate phosphoribosyltransferase-like protein
MKPNFKKYDKHTIRKVFRLWNKGLTQRQIAREIGISRSTVIYIREKYHFRQNRYAGLDTKLIRLKQYEKMNERELQFIL